MLPGEPISATRSEASDVVEAAPAMIWRSGADGLGAYFNRAWIEFTGRLPEDELGWGWLQAVHPDDRASCRDAREAARAGQRDLRVDYRLQRYDGEYRWVAEHAVAAFGERGELLGFVGCCVDVTPRKLLAERLEQASEQLAVLVENLPEAVILKGADGRWQQANSAAQALLGLAPGEWHGRTDSDLAALLPRVREGLLSLHDGDERAWAAGRRNDSVDLVPDPEGLPRYLEVSRVPLFGSSGERRGLVILGRNATERRLAEQALRLAASVFEHNPEGIMITDERQRILRVNRAFVEITGYAPEEVLGRTPRVLSSGRHDRGFYRAMWESVHRTGRWSGEVWNRRRNGEVYPEWLGIVAVTDEQGRVTHYLGTFTDTASRKQVEAEVQRLAYYDPLTGLGNRRFFEERLELELAHAPGALAVIVVDLDRFGAVNHAVGYPAGDTVIRSVGERLERLVGTSGLLAHWYGEQFVLAVQPERGSGTPPAAHAARLAARICETLAEPHPVDGRDIRVTGSLGIALAPQDASSPGELLRCAESALREAKARGGNATRFYCALTDARERERHALEQDLQRAVAQGELCLFYQPQVDAASGAVTGAEALARWRHPLRGFIPAADFVPLAEQTDLIVALGAFVLEACCAQFAAWRREGLGLARVALNISGRELAEPGFAERVGAVLARFGIPPAAIELEMTESALVGHREVAGTLARLRRSGARIAVDDFGTGYSSLGYLKHLPVDVLKIDRSFVSGVPGDGADAAIAKAICTMAQALGLRVIAEGVETAEQARFLREIGAAELQGHFASPALGPDAFASFVRARSQAAPVVA